MIKKKKEKDFLEKHKRMWEFKAGEISQQVE
jgi:hypothetical protein